MGNNQLCNGQEQKRSDREMQAEQAIKMKENSTQQQRNRQEFISCCPQLNQNIIDILLLEKPFQPRFSFQTDKVVYKNGPSIYQGPLNDKYLPQGVTRIYGEDGSLGMGEFDDGRQVGQFYLFLPDGSFYFGSFEAEGTGNGSYRTKNFEYYGAFQEYQFHGFGREKHIGYDFEGEYFEGRRVKGKLSWKNNEHNFIYQGNFDQQNFFHGEGTLTSPEGIFRGNFQRGKKEGKGSFQYSNGLTFQGNYIRGIKNGQGRIVNSNGSICYEGDFKDGLPHGHGYCWDSRGQMREVDFICGISSSHFKFLESRIQG